MDGKQLIAYAVQMFEEEHYDEALEAFVLAYCKGYEQEWILENIYSCYMAGNEQEFQQAYEKQSFLSGISYEQCVLDFVPYREGEYFIFDKELKQFRGKFSVNELEHIVLNGQLLKAFEFSAAALKFDGDWTKKRAKAVLADAKNRMTYAVCTDMKRGMSFWKLPELEPYLKNVRMFPNKQAIQAYFHEHTDVYLPKLVCGEEPELIEIFNEEHAYRLTPEGRNTDNVLLTIAIPTHDRGNLVLQRLANLSQMFYDAEIEIAISKNGTHYYQEEYQQIEKMTDARINYVGYDGELTMALNWQKVIQISHGKYVLMVSDEDDVILSQLEHYLKLLDRAENLGLVRAKTVFQYPNLSENSLYSCGEEAFANGFLANNYLSGIIYHREKFLNLNLKYWDEKYLFNQFYRTYPHLWWDMLLCFDGDYIEDTNVLIEEGESVLQEEAARLLADGVEGELALTIDAAANIPVPSTCEARLEQFDGMIELINDYFSDNYQELKLKAWQMAVNKTQHLIWMICFRRDYKTDEYPEFLAQLMERAIVSLEKLGFDKRFCRYLAERLLNNITQQIENIERVEEN